MALRKIVQSVVFAGAGAALLLGSAASAAADTNLVTNGSFEVPPQGSGYTVYPAGSTAITGWTVGAGSISDASVEQDGPDVWPADTGNVSLDLAGTSPGDLWQNIPTVAGATYTLSFAIGGNFYCPSSGNIKTMKITWDSTVVTHSFNDSGSSASNMNWLHDTVTLVAPGSTSRLDFADISSPASSCGVTLDSVSLTQVPNPSLPETPAVGLLAAVGAALFGAFLLRNRRRHASP